MLTERPPDRDPTWERMPDTAGANLYREDRNLRFALSRHLGPADLEVADRVLEELGAAAGGQLDRVAAEAERHPPELRQLDRRGLPVDEVIHHPAYRELERFAFERFSLAAASHRPGLLGFGRPLPHVVKYALTYVFAQAEFGVLCPVNMTDSLALVLTRFGSPGLKEEFLPRLTAVELEALWQGAMFMTERSGGSDVGATETVARPLEPASEELPDGLVGDAPLWRLHGDKWFCSNVDAELALVLARPVGGPAGTAGLGLFLVPRTLPDGSRNRTRITRLKDKFGTRDMATGEVALDGALAYQVGDLSRGFVQMAVMINASRLSNAVRAAGMMRRAYFESFTHAGYRRAFRERLLDLPLMRRSLLEMLLDTEAAVAAVLETASVLERADAGDPAAGRLARMLTPLLKATVTKRARYTADEAMEVRGGNGYVEEWINPRLVRDTHLGSIWEGTTNVVQLDVLRAMSRDCAQLALFAELGHRIEALRARGRGTAFDGVTRLLAASSERLQARCGEVPGLPRARQELAMHGLVPALYHLVAATSLGEEAAHQLSAEGSARKLLVAAAYAGRWLGDGRRDPLDEPDLLALAEPLERWAPLPESRADELWAQLAPH